VEGKTECRPIVLPEVTSFEFRCLLQFLYDGMYESHRGQEEWIALLSISTRFHFDKIRTMSIKAVAELEPPLDPVERITLSAKYDIPQWLRPAYVDLCVRKIPLTDTEAEKIGLSDAFLLMKAREKYRVQATSDNIVYQCDHKVVASCSVCPAWPNPVRRLKYRDDEPAPDRTLALSAVEDLLASVLGNAKRYW